MSTFGLSLLARTSEQQHAARKRAGEGAARSHRGAIPMKTNISNIIAPLAPQACMPDARTSLSFAHFCVSKPSADCCDCRSLVHFRWATASGCFRFSSSPVLVRLTVGSPVSTISSGTSRIPMKSRSVASWVALALLAMLAAAAVVQANELEMEVGASRRATHCNGNPVQGRRSGVGAQACRVDGH